MCSRRSAVPRPHIPLPQPDLRLPGHPPAALRLRPAPAGALGGAGPVKQRHRRAGQGRHPQLQGQGHRKQDGECRDQTDVTFVWISYGGNINYYTFIVLHFSPRQSFISSLSRYPSHSTQHTGHRKQHPAHRTQGTGQREQDTAHIHTGQSIHGTQHTGHSIHHTFTQDTGYSNYSIHHTA